jgi:hypothetical protein
MRGPSNPRTTQIRKKAYELSSFPPSSTAAMGGFCFVNSFAIYMLMESVAADVVQGERAVVACSF